MENERDINEIKDNVSYIRKNIPGVGLYSMVVLSMFGTCHNNLSKNDVRDVLNNSPAIVSRSDVRKEIRSALNDPNLIGGDGVNQDNVIYRENVIGGIENEAFYLINGERAYTEIDGAPIDK